MLYVIMLFKIIIVLLFSNRSLGIIGGHPSPNYPFFVVVRSEDLACGGTLVQRDAVLTAAHCLYFENEHRWASPLEIYVLHGDFSRPNNWKARYHSCHKIIVHNEYEASPDGSRRPFDVALIKLEDKVRAPNFSQRSIDPVILSLCRYDANRWKRHLFGKAIGLGLTSVIPKIRTDRLMETLLIKIDCKSDVFSNYHIFHSERCYRFFGTSSMSEGDFGGPLVAQYKKKARCLIGCATFTNYHANGNNTIIFTPVDRIRCWLNRVYKEHFADTVLEEVTECEP